ncbi:hypothetical protein ACH5RR_020842 [Cinchona calisaya]|uniref:CCHC-type domain-containing protein n=1 Tax=Cinchona calisaya TaxID=153742 RepID=A0ABD2ZKM1_9GENT
MVRLEEKTVWFNFKYERCPDFCYHCGIVGHSERSCKFRLNNKGITGEPQFGSWLKAGVGKNRTLKQNAAKLNPLGSIARASIGNKPDGVKLDSIRLEILKKPTLEEHSWLKKSKNIIKYSKLHRFNRRMWDQPLSAPRGI